MMRRQSPRRAMTILLPGFLALGAIGSDLSHASEVESKTILERLTPTESIAGITRAGYALEVEAEVVIRCERGNFDCHERKNFPRIYHIEFEIEHIRAEGSTVNRSREERGTIVLALDYGEDDLHAFDEWMLETMAGVSSASFDLPFAGTRPRFHAALFSYVGEGSYACFDDGDSVSLTLYAMQATIDDDGEESTSGSTTGFGGDRAEQTCSILAAATSGIDMSEIRTMSLPRSIVRDEVRLEIADHLPATIPADALVSVPDGTHYEQRPAAPGVDSYSEFSRDSLDHYTGEIVSRGLLTRLRVVPGDLDPLVIADRSWIARWTLRRSEQQLGVHPSTSVLDESSLLTVLLPVEPPIPLDENDNRLAVDTEETITLSLDADTFIDDIAQDLHESSELSTAALRKIVLSRASDLGETNWLIVICADDGTAIFALPPTPAFSRLTNARPFCSEAHKPFAAFASAGSVSLPGLSLRTANKPASHLIRSPRPIKWRSVRPTPTHDPTNTSLGHEITARNSDPR